jgi:acylphosphatase
MQSQSHTRHLVVVGRVQGVGYRLAMGRKARELGVRGWVRNRKDGSVEAVVQGSPAAVAAIMAWARHGPPPARVDRIEVEPAEGSYEGFETRATA